ncbi:hypothetical protein QBC35DRAFT_517456 [Podospora australis]|uniref:Uncharacterized protein n=1 Tax=Podospora australis TaxID=1536484 RepID=A0AAN6WML8_9PEZI|nr:hypothetical protein QBC35DRAFT_517456 [Podospora australis]
MQTISLLTMALALPIFGALAAPLADGASAVASNEKRETPGNVYVCTGPNFTGNCEVLSLGTSGNCVPIPAPYAFNVGSFGPDRGAICRLFDTDHADCTGSGLAILWYPGQSDLGSPEKFHAAQKAAYWRCQTCTNCQ